MAGKINNKKMHAPKNALLQGKAQQKSVKITEHTPFQVAEAYKTIRTNLLFSLAATDNKAIIVSSALPSEGKSSTCANLAITMAQTGAKVVLLDGDFRKPTQYQIFKCANTKGLTTILAGFDTPDDVIIKNIEPKLDIITSGPTPPNPSELLGSDRMAFFIDKLSEHYDYIFIDTPPINVVTDAMVLANKVAGVILVARHGQTTYDELTKAITSIEFAGAGILGVVINGVTERAGGYGKYKYKKYKYSYTEK